LFLANSSVLKYFCKLNVDDEDSGSVAKLVGRHGDVVGALHQVRHFWPEAELSVIVKKGLHDLLPHFPQQYTNSSLAKKIIKVYEAYGTLEG
jgi:hypothetical protein